jgi:C-methyltransferase
MDIKSELKSFFTEHWKYMAVNAACKLNLFDEIEKDLDLTEIAARNNWSLCHLVLLCDALVQIDFLTKSDTTYLLNERSSYLTDKHPESLKYACLNWGSEHLNAWQNLDFSIKSGKSAFEHKYGLPFFDYLSLHPEKLDAYHKAMYAYAKDDYRNLPELIDFSIHKSIIDVGGSYGALLEFVKAKNPSLKCVLFDLEQVVSSVNIPEIVKVSGSFFDEIPAQADALVLSRILHDWDDEKAQLILKNCFTALNQNGALYIIENCSDKIKLDLSLLSLNMTAMCESYERSSATYIQLTESVGFRFETAVKLNELQTILIFKK